MTFDFTKLRERIIEKFGSQGNCAKCLGWSEGTLSLKLSNKVTFSAEDIIRLANHLQIPNSEIEAYFFNIMV